MMQTLAQITCKTLSLLSGDKQFTSQDSSQFLQISFRDLKKLSLFFEPFKNDWSES